MKKIKNRAYFAMLIALGLVFGIAIFTVRLFTDGKDWVMLRANQSVFNGGVMDTGTVTDRNGVILASAGNGVYSYSEDETIRRSCFHAVGDFSGNIGSGAVNAYDYKLAGYDFFNGVASVSGSGGKPSLLRMLLTTATKSAEVSTSVPSRSKSRAPL